MTKGERVRMKNEPEITGEVVRVMETGELKVRFDAAPHDIKTVKETEVEAYDPK